MVTRSLCIPLREKNLQHVNALAIPNRNCLIGDNTELPDQPSCPDQMDPNSQVQSEPSESVPTATPRRSGMVIRPPRALKDYVLH